MIDWEIKPFDGIVSLKIPLCGSWSIIRLPSGHYDINHNTETNQYKNVFTNKYRIIDCAEMVKKKAKEKIEKVLEEHEDKITELKSILKDVENLSICLGDDMFYPENAKFSQKFLEFLFYHKVIERCEINAMVGIDVRTYKFNEQNEKRYYCLYRSKKYYATYGEYATYAEVKENYMENLGYEHADTESYDMFVYDLEKDHEVSCNIKAVVIFEEDVR